MSGIIINPYVYAATGLDQLDNDFYMDFDGADDYVSTGFSYDSLVDPNFSVSFWFKQTSTATFSFPISMQANTGNYYFSGFMIHATRLIIKDASGWNLGTNTNLDDGNWHHLIWTAAYTTGNTVYYAYLDGNLTPDLTVLTSGASHDGERLAGDLYIGAFNGVSNWYTGSIDEVAVWKRILSPSEITDIYNATDLTIDKCADLSELSGGAPVAWYRMGD